jgi:hypothetical protein
MLDTILLRAWMLNLKKTDFYSLVLFLNEVSVPMFGLSPVGQSVQSSWLPPLEKETNRNTHVKELSHAAIETFSDCYSGRWCRSAARNEGTAHLSVPVKSAHMIWQSLASQCTMRRVYCHGSQTLTANTNVQNLFIAVIYCKSVVLRLKDVAASYGKHKV